MANDDLLKEAIADAKAVRETVDLLKSQYMSSKQTLSRSFMKRFLISLIKNLKI